MPTEVGHTQRITHHVCHSHETPRDGGQIRGCHGCGRRRTGTDCQRLWDSMGVVTGEPQTWMEVTASQCECTTWCWTVP